MSEKLQDTENEAMSKIVELEKQLMQRNKELDVVRVSVMVAAGPVGTVGNQLWLQPRRQNPNMVTGFPGGTSGKEAACQCKRHGYSSWIGKIPRRRKWQPTPFFLPGESHGHGSLVGYSPQGCRVAYD